MVELGKYHKLKINRFVDFGAFLDAGGEDEILIPEKYLSGDEKEGDHLDVFVYLDSEERPVATTETPTGTVGEFATVTILENTTYGTFADWKVNKHLFIPFQEQRHELTEGHQAVVYIYVDEMTNRIVGSTKVDKFLPEETPAFEPNEAVSLLIYRRTPIGYEAIINQSAIGLLYSSELFEHIAIGDMKEGYIKQIREDGKIDLTLQKMGYEKVSDFSEELIRYIKENDGSIPYNDKSSADEIQSAFGVSKKTFKKAVGKLYKERLVEITDSGLKSTQ